MAQEVQAVCPSYDKEDISPKANTDVAFSPSIVEIGFIDEETEDGNISSDTSELSLSEEEKLQVCNDPTIATDLEPKTDESGNILSESSSITTKSGTSGSSASHISSDDVPEHASPHDATNHVSSHDMCNHVSHNTTNHVSPHDVPSDQISHDEHTNGIVCSDDQESTTAGDVTRDLVENEVVQNGDAEEVLIPDGTATVDDILSGTLEESMQALQRSMEDKTAVQAFEKLSKKKADACMDVAKLPENAAKNRYKDVLPYDDSRVPLTDCPTADYINASFVKMEIPPLQKVHEYIATQGPLPHTCDDFWQMVWEQKCGVLVMVTTLKERNRVKCHQYWPDLYETAVYGPLQITCFHETTSQEGITRDLLVVNEEKNEDRHIIQMQYVTWPDHGVPEDATDFLKFVQHIREWRKVISGAFVIHCSAGVGRTGVFILMETAMCLIESSNPVHPLELVRKMRDQRVMMVQTVGQYKFICEAILKLYNDYENKAPSITETWS